MTSWLPDLDDDDVAFDPTGWDIAVALGIGPDPATDAEALDELADAMLLWLEGPVLERLTDEAIQRVWSDELETMIREGLLQLREREDWRAGVERAVAELDRDPTRAEVSREVVCHMAMELSHMDLPVLFCADCLEEELSHVGAAVAAWPIWGANRSPRSPSSCNSSRLSRCLRGPRTTRSGGCSETRSVPRSRI